MKTNTILHKFTPDGGFIAGDERTGMTAYATPGSSGAIDAKKDPTRIAKILLRRRNSTSQAYPTAEIEADNAKCWSAIRGD